MLILGQMSNSWDAAITSISAAFGKNEMKLSEVGEMIVTKEIRRLKDGASSSGLALNMESKDKNKSRGIMRVVDPTLRIGDQSPGHPTIIHRIRKVRKILIVGIVVEKDSTKMSVGLPKRTRATR